MYHTYCILIYTRMYMHMHVYICMNTYIYTSPRYTPIHLHHYSHTLVYRVLCAPSAIQVYNLYPCMRVVYVSYIYTCTYIAHTYAYTCIYMAMIRIVPPPPNCQVPPINHTCHHTPDCHPDFCPYGPNFAPSMLRQEAGFSAGFTGHG